MAVPRRVLKKNSLKISQQLRIIKPFYLLLQIHFPYLSLVFICRAFASIFAPISPMAFPLISTFVREVLLPKALIMMVTSVFSLESARDNDCRGWGAQKRH